MKEYLIDGNNLIHKIKNLVSLQKKDRQLVREKLAIKLDGYFADKTVKVSLYFDGFETLPIRTNKIRIIYSDKITADYKIREAIENSLSPRNLVIISSDDEIKKLAQACSGSTINSEEFVSVLYYGQRKEEDEKRINEFDNDEFKRLFGIDE